MRVLLVKSLSGYDATRVFIDQIALAFEETGAETVVCDVAGVDESQIALAIGRAAEGLTFDLVLTIGLFGELRDGDGRSIAEIVGAPHVVHYVDYPLSHYQRLSQTPANTALVVVDPSHVDAVRSVYGADRFAHVGFAPHAATLFDIEPQAATAEEFAALRPIPILFPASFYKPGPPMWRDLDPELAAIFDDALMIALGEEFIPALEAFDRALRMRGKDPADPALRPFRVNAFAVHDQVRHYRRLALFETAARVGLEIDVYGAGYDVDLYRYPNVFYRGEADLETIAALMRRSRMVMNVNANFGAGSHERPLTAMAAGAVAVSDQSSFYEDRFRADQDMVLYRWLRLEEDLAAVVELAKDNEGLFQIARSGQAKALASHRWRDRLPAYLRAAEAARAA